MVDPQLQAIYWIKKREGNKLQVGRLGQKDLISRILKAVESGQPFLIENMGEHIDPSLMVTPPPSLPLFPPCLSGDVFPANHWKSHRAPSEQEVPPDWRPRG